MYRYRSPCLSRQQGKDRAFLRLGKHIPSGALAQSCRLPADATGGVFSPCRLLVTLDRQPEPEVLMASSAPVSYTHLDVYKRQIWNYIMKRKALS